MPLTNQTVRFAKLNELGSSLVEYALMIALISVVCLGALAALGGQNGTGVDNSASTISSAIN